jgi:hypothetical protein
VKVLLPDGTDFEDFLDEMKEESKKKNLRNFINNHFSGYAGYRSFYIITHPWEILLEWKRQIKYAWQRVVNGYDERVSWSIDWYLSEMIPKWINDLKSKEQGCPSGMFDGLPYDENGRYFEEDEKFAHNKWNDILDQIIIGFENYPSMSEFEHDSKEYKESIQKFENGFNLFREWFSALWW